LAFTHEDAAPTPTQLGLRVSQDVRLVEDPKNSLQCEAVEVDEHEELYQDQQEQDQYQYQEQDDDYNYDSDYYQVATPPIQPGKVEEG
jgi:hypothetical protein